MDMRTPEWRVPPSRTGPLEQDPAWLRNLEALAPWGCVGIAAGLLAAAALTWIFGA